MFYAVDPEGQTHSPFGYVAGNPISLIDPTGRSFSTGGHSEGWVGTWWVPDPAYSIDGLRVSSQHFNILVGDMARDYQKGLQQWQYQEFQKGNYYFGGPGSGHYEAIWYDNTHVTNVWDYDNKKWVAYTALGIRSEIVGWNWVPGSNNSSFSNIFGSWPTGGGIIGAYDFEHGYWGQAVGGQVSGGIGVDTKISKVGGFGSAGGLFGKVDGKNQAMNGLYTGSGFGFYLTNADFNQLNGAADVVNLNLGWPIPQPLQFSVSLASMGNGLYSLSITKGPGLGISVSRYTTYTKSAGAR